MDTENVCLCVWFIGICVFIHLSFLVAEKISFEWLMQSYERLQLSAIMAEDSRILCKRDKPLMIKRPKFEKLLPVKTD